ncbi:MAG: hypothetical protein WC476_01705 [Phycisphaerae bacterium]|jgi:hypothetical protein
MVKQPARIQAMRDYVNAALDRTKVNNILIYSPDLSAKDKETLSDEFIIDNALMGYHRFTRKEV